MRNTPSGSSSWNASSPHAAASPLTSHNPRFVSLAQEILPDGDGFRAVTHIPMSIVERIERLDIRA